jgi:hypothetical protein
MASLGDNSDRGTQLRTLSLRRDEEGLQHPSPEDHQENDDGPGLDPVDRGRPAWRMLFSAFIFESLLWGECRPLGNSFQYLISVRDITTSSFGFIALRFKSN